MDNERKAKRIFTEEEWREACRIWMETKEEEPFSEFETPLGPSPLDEMEPSKESK